MIYRIVYDPRARSDLRRIYYNLAVNLEAPEHAARLYHTSKERIDKLRWMPERYRLYEWEPYRSQGIRVMPVKRYLVFYRPNPETVQVEIHRILYGGMDLSAALHDTEP